MSAGLPSDFVFVSSVIALQMLLNIPLSTVLLTHGAGILFLFWDITPCPMFARKCSGTMQARMVNAVSPHLS
jgi:hypothetical protein